MTFPPTLHRLFLYGNYIQPAQLETLQLHKQCPDLKELRVFSRNYEYQHPLETHILQLCVEERNRRRRIRLFAACVYASKTQRCSLASFLTRWKIFRHVLQFIP